MKKETTRQIKGIAILLMIFHHFCGTALFPELGEMWIRLGASCKICVAIYAVLSGYGYFFAKEKTVRYGLKKIWGLLEIYWLSLFTLFIPAAIRGGVEAYTGGIGHSVVWAVSQLEFLCLVCLFLCVLYAGNAVFIPHIPEKPAPQCADRFADSICPGDIAAQRTGLFGDKGCLCPV